MLQKSLLFHRHAFNSKKMLSKLKQVLNKVCMYCKLCQMYPLQSRLFKKLCEEMDSQHYLHLLHINFQAEKF